MKLRHSLADSVSRDLEASVSTLAASDFERAPWNEEDSERTGYSNYSYWRSTFRCFRKNRLAMVLLVLLVTLIVFTIIQPWLPGQYEANLIINHPVTERQMSNVQPSLTSVAVRAEAGTELVVTTSWENDEWAAVSNVLANIKARQTFTVLAYGDDFCRVEFDGQEGYVRNDFTTKLKLPEDATAVPYESKSNFALKLYSSPRDLTRDGDELFARKTDLVLSEDGKTAVVGNGGADLHILPDGRPFLFGTNNIGQDLWARVWSGTRTSLLIGIIVALLQSLIGILIGVLWGYVRKLDPILTEVYNVIDNVPTTIVLILVSYVLRPGVRTLILAMTVTGWVGMARFIRNQIVIIRDRDYNLASRCLGVGTARIILRNLLPYLVSVIMLRMALAVPGAIGNEVFVTYIGLGLPVSIPSLGNLINEGRRLLSTSQSYQLVFPTLVLSVITISFYIIGNSFADAAEPKNHL